MMVWKIYVCLKKKKKKKKGRLICNKQLEPNTLLVVLHFSLNTVLVQQREKISSTPSVGEDWLTSGSSCSASTDAVLTEKPTRDVQVEFKWTEDRHQQQVAEQGRSEVFRNCCAVKVMKCVWRERQIALLSVQTLRIKNLREKCVFLKWKFTCTAIFSSRNLWEKRGKE